MYDCVLSENRALQLLETCVNPSQLRTIKEIAINQVQANRVPMPYAERCSIVQGDVSTVAKATGLQIWKSIVEENGLSFREFSQQILGVKQPLQQEKCHCIYWSV